MELHDRDGRLLLRRAAWMARHGIEPGDAVDLDAGTVTKAGGAVTKLAGGRAPAALPDIPAVADELAGLVNEL